MTTSQTVNYPRQLLPTLIEICNKLTSSHERDEIIDQILQTIDLGIYTIDTDLHITSWNTYMEQTSGIAATSALGHKLLELFPSLEQEGLADVLQQALNTGAANNLRLSHYSRHSKHSIQRRRITPLRDKGQVIGALIVVKDISSLSQQIEKAKGVLINQGLSEPEAHRQMQKMAMNKRKSLGEVAAAILWMKEG